MTRASMPGAAVALVSLAFAAACAAFVVQPGIATFADDSVSYLIMAQVFSPWQAPSPAVADAFAREASYPPLYPLLLAAAGAGHDIARAHGLTALVLAACLPLAYGLARRWLASPWAAVAVAAVTALTPALWINAKGTLSEPLFTALLLALLWVVSERRSGLGVALLLAALVLTRTAGFALVGGYAAWALFASPHRLRALAPAAAPAAAYALWVLLRPAETADANVRLAGEFLSQQGVLAQSLARQSAAIGEAWIGSLLLFWVEGRPLRVALAAVVGALALGGLALRFVRREPDAWIMAAYLAAFLAWPFYDQMTRFLFPAVPVLLLYAFFAAAAIARAARRPPALAHGVVALLIASLAVPALGFMHARAQSEGRIAQMTDWYRRPDLDEARRRAAVHVDLLADMEVIRALTPPEARVMWVAPGYIALLAQRRGVPAPRPHQSLQAYRAAVAAARPDFVFLSVYHPRDTTRDVAWRAGMQALSGHGEVVHVRRSADGAVSSALIALRPAELEKWRANPAT